MPGGWLGDEVGRDGKSEKYRGKVSGLRGRLGMGKGGKGREGDGCHGGGGGRRGVWIERYPV